MRNHRLLCFTYTLLCTQLALAASSGGSCSQANTKLQVGTYQLTGDCTSTTFCDGDGKCQPRGCRRDDFPQGYTDPGDFPPKCRPSQFCPDEGDKCQEKLAVGSQCQLNRDDECMGPPNFKELSDDRYNSNGSVCINYQCMWANATAGSDCQIEQTPYIAYGKGNYEFIYVVSRGNCKSGLYCDADKKKCLQNKQLGEACTADKECDSNNCIPGSLRCGGDPAAPKHFGTGVYVAVGVSILLGMAGTLVGMFMFHRKTREHEREKRAQYWREQNAYRQNILHMQRTAKHSIFSTSMMDEGSRTSVYFAPPHCGDSPTESSLRHAGGYTQQY